jgi:hypothetical protein
VLQNRVVERAATVTRSVNNRAKITNNPRRLPVSGRTALGRRIHDLADGFADVLGGWSALGDVLAANVMRAAQLTALAEQKRAEALRDGNVDPLAVVRLEGAANRAVRALHLDRKRDPAEQTLDQYLRAHAAAPVAAPRTAQNRERAPEVPSNEERISGAPDGFGEAAA